MQALRIFQLQQKKARENDNTFEEMIMNVATELIIPKRIYHKDDSNKKFYRNAILGSLLLHLLFFLMKLPELDMKVAEKAKVEPIKMNFITSTISHELRKNKISVDATQPHVETKLESGVKKVTTHEVGKTGNPNSKDLAEHKSKKGSEKKGAFSDPGIATGALGDSVTKGYEFKGRGLKALMGNSQTMTVAAGSGTEGSMGLTAGTGIANKGNNLSGEYRAPAGTGDGSGHLLGNDAVGNYDRSTTTKGLANKKGFDTAFVEADTVILGSIDPEVLRRILQEYLPQFKFCYQQELQENSEKLKGIVDLNFRIEGTGKVSVVRIKSASTKFSEKGIGCMGNILRMIPFPKPKGGGLVDVRQPLNFSSESTKM